MMTDKEINKKIEKSVNRLVTFYHIYGKILKIKRFINCISEKIKNNLGKFLIIYTLLIYFILKNY